MHKRTSTAIPEIIPLKRWVIWWVSDKADIPAVPAICLLCVGYLGHPHTSLCCVRERAESIFNAGNASQWQTTNKALTKGTSHESKTWEALKIHLTPSCLPNAPWFELYLMDALFIVYLFMNLANLILLGFSSYFPTDLQKVCFTLNFPLCGTDLLNRANYHYSGIP